MKRMLFCLCILSSLSAFAAPTGPTAVINREIAKLVTLYTDGFGHNDAAMRHITFGSLFNDKQDAVAFFSLAEMDNSNVHFEYIAIFAQGQGRDMSSVRGPKERPYHLVTTAMVGGRGTRTLDWKTAKISKGQIVVQGTRWAENDAGCCPTKPIAVTFSVSTDVANGLPPEQYPLLRESEGPGQARPKKSARPGTKSGDN